MFSKSQNENLIQEAFSYVEFLNAFYLFLSPDKDPAYPVLCVLTDDSSFQNDQGHHLVIY